MLLSLTHSVSPQVGDIVGITRRRHRHICAIFQACCANFLPLDTRILFFCILLWKLNIRCMNRHPVSVGSRGGQTCFLMVFHASLRQILNCYFCAISLWELPVCAIFYAFFQLWLGDWEEQILRVAIQSLGVGNTVCSSTTWCFTNYIWSVFIMLTIQIYFGNTHNVLNNLNYIYL